MSPSFSSARPDCGRSPLRRLILAVVWACLLAGLPVTLQAQAGKVDPALELSTRVASDAFRGHILGYQEHGSRLTPEQALARLGNGGFAALPGPAPDFGFTPEAIWLYIPTTNPTDKSEWRLRLRENFFQEFSAWYVPSGDRPVLRERQHETTGFATRAVEWAELVVPFTQPPGTTGAILIRYRSGGSTEVEFTLFDVDSFNAWTASKTARHFMYYGMLLFLIMAALATWLATQRAIFLAYSAYALAGLLFVMHGDGNTFRYLWPDAPGFNGFATIPLGAGIIVCGANFARQFLQTALYHPVFDRLLQVTILVTLLTAASSVFLDTQMIKKVLVLMAFGSVLLFTASGLNAARTRFREVRFFVLAWSGAVISSAIMTGRHWLGIEISEEVQFDSMRIVLVLDAALMGLAIIDRFDGLRRSRADALKVSLDQAQENLAMSRRLQALEQRYALASELARNRERQVADAFHDLRQPLHALRLNVEDLLAGNDPDRKPPRREIEETFRMLEGLVTDELHANIPGPVRDTETGDTALALDEVFAAVTSMFGRDAQAKGLTLGHGPTDATLHLPAISVMRILTNLVSNAVTYTQAGAVRVEAVPTSQGVQIAVHDTGPGLTPTAFEAAKVRGARLDPAEQPGGSGLGLAIVAQTCSDLGLGFALLPSQLGGTSLGVLVGPEHLS
ncbi:sensor histidine kinase [Mesobacterium sp. TK19101]|uniref:histidine kinase n=1 Tax=Mesobacterium hydrothermale TaxID=3111907 RepID=A0ABU6HDC4_9RHOB|nr:sensor histidine kinase [Mesobacterium sp. TK19101]MEC3860464.1 sensor histidine kinase [Mesobacterium sp. TK19101]